MPVLPGIAQKSLKVAKVTTYHMSRLSQLSQYSE